MSAKLTFSLTVITAVVFLVGCQSIPPGAERGPDGTMAYDVLVDASAPGARIRANGTDLGNTPVHLKIFGDPDGTFHDFGSYYYVVEALPLTTNQFPQSRYFRTGHLMSPEDHIPQQIYFDMNQNTPVYGYPNPAPPVYYGAPPPTYYVPPPYYYGPGVGVYIGPSYRYHRHW
ncbi:hypothetical protein [Pedosphaera parvula]|uniref:Lipoprotein n=1 Tax=Pedosphaera parvula (strain Ellin514) TaxID=320771 RepID=B9XM44_PEDPL|nr:hypothetical protein [Pedosphaera parvula]EEF59037.1 hypothetical protein Cflav_PD2164 [Pedosphaera parvula Ellin514]